MEFLICLKCNRVFLSYSRIIDSVPAHPDLPEDILETCGWDGKCIGALQDPDTEPSSISLNVNSTETHIGRRGELTLFSEFKTRVSSACRLHVYVAC